ncbi:MAG: ECF transporter S component [Clostridia bacterium]|nr:ECF transporter S component [Clostridia bacterium]
MKNHEKLRKITGIAVFSAIAYLCTFIMPIRVQFLTFDVKDAVMTIGALCYGPLSAVIMPLIVSLLEYFTISSTGIYGLIMNFASSAAFILPAVLIYPNRRTIGRAYLSLASSVLSMTVIMLALNLVITPYYMHAERAAVVALILPLLLPFNLLKGIVNAAIVLLLYKPVSRAMHWMRREEPKSAPSVLRTVLACVVGVLLLALALFFLFYTMQAEFVK